MNLYTVATIGIYGAALDPDLLTYRIGTKPAHAHRLGDNRVTKSGLNVEARTGAWVLHCKAEHPAYTLDDLIDKILKNFDPINGSLRDLQGVEDAHLALAFIDENSGQPEMGRISPAHLQRIAELELQLTIEIYSHESIEEE